MTVPYTLTGKLTTEEIIFTESTFAESDGLNHFFPPWLQMVPYSLLDTFVYVSVYLIGPRGAECREGKREQISSMHIYSLMNDACRNTYGERERLDWISCRQQSRESFPQSFRIKQLDHVGSNQSDTNFC
jgi:hypothetical protein